MKTQYLLVILLFTLTACGFHLRGSQQNAAVVVAKVYVSTEAANTVAKEVKLQMVGAGAAAVKDTAQAEFTLKLEKEYFEQTVLSVSAQTGKVEEYKITLTVYMSVIDANGTELLVAEQVRSARDYTFDENAVLGKFAEEKVIRDELTRQVASQILRRLDSVTSSVK